MKTDIINMKKKIKAMPKGEEKDAMKEALKVIQHVDDLVADYEQLTNNQKESLPESTRAFFEKG